MTKLKLHVSLYRYSLRTLAITVTNMHNTSIAIHLALHWQPTLDFLFSLFPRTFANICVLQATGTFMPINATHKATQIHADRTRQYITELYTYIL